jgi:two-component system, NarL family, sensor kinase
MHNYVKTRAEENKNKLLIAFIAEENERSRISKELHDSIGIKLSLIKLELELLDKKNDGILKDELPNLLRETIQEVRMISRTQSSQFLIENGLVNELNLLVRNLMRLKKIDCLINIHCDISKYNNDFQIHLYRILQELLNNTIKHSNANLITLDIDETPDDLMVKYVDNGSGIQNDEKTGSGIKNINTRVGIWEGVIFQKDSLVSRFTFNCKFSKKKIMYPN